MNPKTVYEILFVVYLICVIVLAHKTIKKRTGKAIWEDDGKLFGESDSIMIASAFILGVPFGIIYLLLKWLFSLTC